MKKIECKLLSNSHVQNVFPVLLLNFFSIVFAFLIPKLIISYYGSEIHGLTSTISSIITYSTLLEAGISTSATFALYVPLSSNKLSEINGILNATRISLYRVSKILGVFVVLFSLIIPVVYKIELSFLYIFMVVLAMGFANVIDLIASSKNRILLQADTKVHLINWVNSIGVLVQGIVRVLLVLSNQSIVLVQMVPVFTNLMKSMIFEAYVRYHYKFLDASVTPLFLSLKHRGSILVHQISNLIVNNTDIIVLSVVRDFTTVSIYVVYILVINSINQLINQIFVQSLSSTLGKQLNHERFQEAIEFYDRFEKYYYYLIAFIYSATLLLILPFVEIYTDRLYNPSFYSIKIAFLFTLIGFLSSVRIPQLIMINATGKFKETQDQAIYESIINLSISILLAPYFGLVGVLMGTIASYSYRTLSMIIFVSREIIGRKLWRTLIRLLLSIIIGFVMYGVDQLLSLSSRIVSWQGWIYSGALISLVLLIIIAIVESINIVLKQTRKRFNQ